MSSFGLQTNYKAFIFIVVIISVFFCGFFFEKNVEIEPEEEIMPSESLHSRLDHLRPLQLQFQPASPLLLLSWADSPSYKL